jgi:hypothetical protein
MSSVVADVPVSSARPRCSCDAGTADTSQKAGAHRIRIRGSSRVAPAISSSVRCSGG